MIKYLNISNFDKVENIVLGHPERVYTTNDFDYWMEPVYECAKLLRRAKNNGNGHQKGKIELVAYYHKGEWE